MGCVCGGGSDDDAGSGDASTSDRAYPPNTFLSPHTPDAAAEAFGRSALTADPIKVHWDNLHEFNDCAPSKVNVPTLLVHGDQDPYTSFAAQRYLFENLGCPDKAWVVLPNSDHAVHLLEDRQGTFVRSLDWWLHRKEGALGGRRAT